MEIAYFDLETQYTFEELGMTTGQNRDPSKLKVALAGICFGGKHHFFTEDQVLALFDQLMTAELIVGHNLFRFDYKVLLPYLGKERIIELEAKTFDMQHELDKLTHCWVGLDDLGTRNLGISKTVKATEIPKLWREGKIQQVTDYCSNDLTMTEGIFNHAKREGKLKYEHKDYGKSCGEREVKVAW